MRPEYGLAVAAALAVWTAAAGDRPAETAEFHFVRLEYRDLPGMSRRFGRGWWRQDWPEAETHFAQGVRRLTAIDVGEGVHFGLTDDRLFDYPWVYATQVGYWDLSDEEIARLREYLLRGGFLMTDDFYGDRQWEVFRESMARAFPDRAIFEVPTTTPRCTSCSTSTARSRSPDCGTYVRAPAAAPSPNRRTPARTGAASTTTTAA